MAIHAPVKQMPPIGNQHGFQHSLAVHNENLAKVQDESNIQIIHNLKISKYHGATLLTRLPSLIRRRLVFKITILGNGRGTTSR